MGILTSIELTEDSEETGESGGEVISVEHSDSAIESMDDRLLVIRRLELLK